MVTNGDFAGVPHGPGGNADYTAEAGTAGAVRCYYRKFQNNTPSSRAKWTLEIKGTGINLVANSGGGGAGIVNNLNSDPTKDVHIFWRIPGSSQWVDGNKPFVGGSFLEGDGCFDGSIVGPGGPNVGDPPNSSGGTNSTYGVNVGTVGTVLPFDHVVLWIVTRSEFEGEFHELELEWA